MNGFWLGFFAGAVGVFIFYLLIVAFFALRSSDSAADDNQWGRL